MMEMEGARRLEFMICRISPASGGPTGGLPRTQIGDFHPKTLGFAESIMAAYRRVDDLKSHLRANCLYIGISSGPNARKRVWENFTCTFTVCRLLRCVRVTLVVHWPATTKAAGCCTE